MPSEHDAGDHVFSLRNREAAIDLRRQAASIATTAHALQSKTVIDVGRSKVREKIKCFDQLRVKNWRTAAFVMFS